MNRLTEKFFRAPTGVFTQSDVAVLVDGTEFSRHGLIKRAISAGEILNIRRGLYCLAPEYQKKPVSVYSLAQRVYGPSYISMETALSYHGWIPEAVYTCTCASFGNSKVFETPLGVFSYKRVPQRTFYLGVERCKDENGNVFFMASPAKALADYLYIHQLKWARIDEPAGSLRIFYGLNRFSGDMDFILRETTSDFQLKDHIKHLTDELAAYGYKIEITGRDKVDATVKEAFLKDDTLGKVINLRHTNQTGQMAKIRIKFKVDTNPPAGSGYELKYLDFPFVSSVAVQDRASLFAGKIHALLCREYIKGRDWYDFIWYTGNHTEINYDFLASAVNQFGPWQGQSITVDKAWLLNELERTITSINWKQAAEDVRRFLRVEEQPSLDLWSKELFLVQLDKLKRVGQQ